MRQPPPTSTLFPYTTLFRSVKNTLGLSGQRPGNRDRALHSGGKIRGQQVTHFFDAHHFQQAIDDLKNLFFSQIPSDRKSTRLNSSHEWISYAVFCLKKKI